MLFEIDNALRQDSYISKHVDERIKAYQYPKASDLHAPHIIIDPLDVPIPSDFADDVWLTNDFIYQIEAWSYDYAITKELSHRIRLVMWSLGFGQADGMDEYDKDFNIYRDARRYRGKAYRKDLNSL